MQPSVTRRVERVTLAVVIGLGCWYAPGVVRVAYDLARQGATTSRTERELLPAHVVGIEDTSVFPRLATLIPPKATYSVELSSDAPPGESAGGYVQGWLNYWLPPRRFVPQNENPDYLIFLGTVSDAAGARKVTTVGAGITLVQEH